MNQSRLGIVSGMMVFLLCVSFPVASRAQDPVQPHIGPQLKPLVKLVGFLNATPAPTNVQPLVTFKLPSDEKRYTFLVTEMKVMAGPLRTAESILSEVKPYTPNFQVRTSREIAAQIAAANPTERLTILAEYSQSDRALQIQGFEKSSDESNQ